MRILSVDTAGKGLSLALLDFDADTEARVLGFAGLNVGLTHSQRLLPLLESLLADAGVELGSVDGVAVVNGPGSFTGLRIGVATAKGLAWGCGKPLVAVSTLEAAAYNAFAPGTGADIVACPVLDARRNEVYNALYAVREDNRGLRELCPARALSPTELAAELAAVLRDKRAVLVGDAAELIFPELRERLPVELRERIALAAPERRFFNAVGCAMAAAPRLAAGEGKNAAEVGAFYLRKSEAERNRLAKLGDKT